MCINEKDFPEPCTLSLMGISYFVVWGGLLYLFNNIILLPIGWSIVCSYIGFSIMGCSIFYILYKIKSCREDNNLIESTISIDSPKFIKTEKCSLPEYNTSNKNSV